MRRLREGIILRIIRFFIKTRKNPVIRKNGEQIEIAKQEKERES